MGIHISSFCVEKEQREIIQWSLYDNRPLVFRVGKKNWLKWGCLHNHEVKRKHLLFLVAQKLGTQSETMQWNMLWVYWAQQEEFSFQFRKPRTLPYQKSRRVPGQASRKTSAPSLFTNPLLACTGRLEITVDKTRLIPYGYFIKRMTSGVFT